MNIEAIIEEHSHHFLQGMKTEYEGDKKAEIIIQSYLRTGTITEDEEHLLKTQLIDSLKIVGIGIPFALLPGASVLIPILIKVADKYNIQLLPSAFDTNGDKPEK